MKKNPYACFALFYFGLIQLCAQSPLINEWPGLPDPDDPYGYFDYTAIEEVIFNNNFVFDAALDGDMHAFIDQTIIGSEPVGILLTQAEFDQPIDLQAAVGNIVVSSSVSGSGSALYNVPIDLPSGTNGLVPNLSINYNSHGGNGLLGLGWDLAGVSSIHRVAQNLHNDNRVGRLYAHDALAIDGQRLIKTSQFTNIEGMEFGTESETFIKVISHGTDKIEWFEVFTKDDKILTYGLHPYDEINHEVGGNVSTKRISPWYLTKVEDRYSNYILYEYLEEHKEVRLDCIRYTGNFNENILPYNKIQFQYSDRQDPNYHLVRPYASDWWLNSHRSNTTLLLSDIVVTYENSPYNKYSFVYGYDGLYSFLNEIVVSGSDGTALNPLRFKYHENDLEVESHTLSSFQDGDKYIYGDFNKDGYSDYVYLDDWTDAWGQNRILSWSLNLNDQQGGFNYISSGPINQPSHVFNNPGSLNNTWLTALLGMNEASGIGAPRGGFNISSDFNGDGYEDFVISDIYIDIRNRTRLENLQVFIMDPETNSFNVQTIQPVDHNNINYDYLAGEFFWVGDYDGNGTTDIMTYTNGVLDYENNGVIGSLALNGVLPPEGIPNFNSMITVYDIYNDDIKFITSPPCSTTQNDDYSKPIINPKIMDYNGDGKSDLMFFRPDLSAYMGITMINNNGNLDFNYVSTGEPSAPQNTGDAYSADFNGDGTWDIYPANGFDGVIVDVNGDGKSDKISISSTKLVVNSYDIDEITILDEYNQPEYVFNEYELNVTRKITFQIELSNGQAFKEIMTDEVDEDTFSITFNDMTIHDVLGGNTFNDISPSQEFTASKFNRSIGNILDISGDGLVDFKLKGSNKVFSLYTKDSNNRLALKKIKDSYGKVTEIKYSTLSDDLVYVNQDIHIFPIKPISMSLQVASEFKTQNPVGGNDYSSYRYKGGMTHSYGRGFLGFDKTWVQSHSEGGANDGATMVVNTFITNVEHYVSYIASTSVYKIDDPINTPFLQDDLMSSTNYVNTSFENLGNNRFWHKTNTTESIKKYESSVTSHIISSYIYDSMGNVESITENESSGLLVRNTTNIYHPNDNWWSQNKINESTATITKLGQNPITSSIHYTYSPNGRIKERFDNYNTSRQVKTDVTNINSFGLPQETTLSSGTLDSKSVELVYDSRGRFIVERINPLNQSSRAEYHPLWSQPSKITDIWGYETNFEYDGWGQLIKKIDPNGVVTEYQMEFVSNSPGWSDSDAFTANDALYRVSVNRDGTPLKETYYNKFGFEVKIVSEGHFENLINIVQYNNLGKEATRTEPHFSDNPNGKISKKYDEYGRKETISSITQSGVVLATSYDYDWIDELSQWRNTITKPNETVISYIDVLGNTVKVIDVGGSELIYDHYSDGKLKSTFIDGVEAAFLEYDDWGNRDYLRDPDAGITTFKYDAYGQLTEQVDGKGNTFLMEYDLVGRLESNTGPDGQYTYQYVQSGHGLNAIQRVTAPNGYFTEYEYGQYNLLESVEENIDGNSFNTNFEYDTFGRVIRKVDPGNFATRNVYNDNGYLSAVMTDDLQVKIWEPTTQDSRGNYNQFKLGNGSKTITTYDEFGLTENISCSNGNGSVIQNLGFDWEHVTGNLESRSDHQRGLKETFTYDNKRLHTYHVTNPTEGTSLSNMTVNYSANGNIDDKTDVGDYSYNVTPRPHAVTSVSDDQEIIRSTPQNITYNDFNSTKSITQGTLNLDLHYGSDKQRRKQIFTRGVELLKTKYFVGGYELEEENGVTREISYISGGNGICAMHVKETNNTDRLYYFSKDHLGSITLITDDEGVVVHEQNFDPWGRYRDPETWQYLNQGETVDADQNNDQIDDWVSEIAGSGWGWFARGFTSHEMLPEFGLINMNGRSYDPVLGRMTQVDNFVQNPYDAQNYNRYSYALNNPLKYVDPSGETIGIFLSTAIGAVSGAIIGYGIGHLIDGQDGAELGAKIGFVVGALVGLHFGLKANLHKGLGDLFRGQKTDVGKGNWTRGFKNTIKKIARIPRDIKDFLAGHDLEPLKKFVNNRLLPIAGHRVLDLPNGGLAVMNRIPNRLEYGSHIVYQRTAETDNSTTGIFTIPGTPITGFFIEPAGESTTTANLDRRIPAGIYNLIQNTGPRYPDALRLYNEDVPESRAILIHVGNYPGDTSGCLLPGCSMGVDAVYDSGDMIDRIMFHFNYIGLDNATIEIIDIVEP